MRKTLLLLFFLGLSTLSGLRTQPASAASAAEAAPVWRVCVGDLVILPYISGDPAKPGLIERLLLESGRQAGLAVELLRYPFKRCSAMFEAGQIDAMTLAPVEMNRQRYQFPLSKGGTVDAGLRLARLNIVWVRRAETQLDWDGQQFIGADGLTAAQPLIGSRNTLGVAKVALRAQGYTVDDAAISTRQAMAKLKGHRFDVVVGLQEEVEAALREPGLDGLLVLQRPFIVADYHAAVRKNLSAEQQQRVETSWNAIGRLRETADFKPH